MIPSLAALALLTTLSVVAAVAVTSRLRLAGRAETLVAATLVWNALVLVPIYALGWSHALTAGHLASASTCVSGSALALAFVGRPIAAQARVTGRELLGLARLPLDALLLAARPLNLVFVAVLGTELLLLWSLASAYYGHAWRMWDTLWYHEPIVAFTIQYRGFGVIPLPDSLQRINAFPRAGEMTDLWFAIFAGRRLIDVANCLLSPALLAAEYLLCARWAKSRVVALGWACALFLTPSNVWELGSTLVDLHLSLVLLGALWFATRPRALLSHCGLAALALTLAVGMKYPALAPAGVIAVIVLVRVWLARSSRLLARAAVTFAGAAAIAAAGADTYLRNYLAFKNPFWPYLIPSHKEWPGFPEPGQDLTSAGVDFGSSRDEIWKDLFSAPLAAVNYGLGFAWVILPLFAVAVLVVGARVLSSATRAVGRVPREAGADGRTLLLLVVGCLPAVAVVWTSPGLDQGRYHGFVVGTMIALIAWTGRTRLGGLAGEGAIAAVCLLSIMGFFDADPPYVFTPRELRRLMALPPVEREVDTALGSATLRETGLARERELGPGDLLVFADDYGGFPSEFFNNQFSNRAIWVSDAHDFLKNAEAIGAKWIYCGERTTCADEVEAPESGWVAVGELHVKDDGSVYHRRPTQGPTHP